MNPQAGLFVFVRPVRWLSRNRGGLDYALTPYAGWQSKTGMLRSVRAR